MVGQGAAAAGHVGRPDHHPGHPGHPGRCGPFGRVAVAFSGGRDSLALLHATCRAAHALSLSVVALHVHHGLQPEADAWQRQAHALVRRWRRRGWPVSLRCERLSGTPPAGESVEAWARAGRRRALWRMAHAEGASLLLLAQHRRDQAETVVLQLLRGAGTAGLAAMPAQARRAGLVWARPWLDQPRQAIDAYVRRHRLQPVEDPSNGDPRWARNRLHLAVWPTLLGAFPGGEQALALSARRAAEDDAVLREAVAEWLPPLLDAQGRLKLSDWRRTSPARQAAVLRHWWRLRAGRGAPETLVRRLLLEAPRADADAAARLEREAPRRAADPPRRWPPVDGWQAAAWRGWLDVVPEAAAPATVPAPAAVPLPTAQAQCAAQAANESQEAQKAQGARAAVTSTRPLDAKHPWPALGDYRVDGWAGVLRVRAARRGEAGLSAADLLSAHWRPRAGGERFQSGPHAVPQRLKKAWQAAGVPAWARHAPLLWRADKAHPLWVAGLGVDARASGPAAVPPDAPEGRTGPPGPPGRRGRAGGAGGAVCGTGGFTLEWRVD